MKISTNNFYKNFRIFNENKELRESISKSETEKQFILTQKNDIVSYLNKELEEKTHEIQNLNLKISSFDVSKKFCQETLETALKEKDCFYEEKINMLNNKNLQLGL